MGDILSGVFGKSTRTSQETRPDATAQALNRLTLSELSGLFDQSHFADFAREYPDLYSLSPTSEGLLNQLTSGGDVLGFNEYLNMGLNASGNYIEQIAKPQIMSAATLQGLEQSGAVPEALARASAEYALPFITGLPQAAASIQNQRAGLFSLSDIPRQLGVEDLTRRQGVLTTGLTGIPFSPGSRTTGREASDPFFGFFGQG